MARVIRNFKRKDNAVEVNEYKIGSSEEYVNVTNPFATGASTNTTTSTNTTISLKTFLQDLKTNIVTYLKTNLVFGKTNTTNPGLVPSSATTAATKSGTSFLTSAGKWMTPVDTTYSTYNSNSTGGLVSKNFPSTSTAQTSDRLLSKSGQWLSLPSQAFVNTTYGTYTSATASAKGTNGLVSGPAIGTTATYTNTTTSLYWLNAGGGWKKIPDATAAHEGLMSTALYQKLSNYPTVGTSTAQYLRANGTWGAIPNASGSAAGLMTSALFNKLSNYPTIGTSTAQYLRANGTWGAIPSASASVDGLMSATDKTKLNHIRQHGSITGGAVTSWSGQASDWTAYDLITVWVHFAGTNDGYFIASFPVSNITSSPWYLNDYKGHRLLSISSTSITRANTSDVAKFSVQGVKLH